MGYGPYGNLHMHGSKGKGLASCKTLALIAAAKKAL